MLSSVNTINQLKFKLSDDGLSHNLESAYKLISEDLRDDEKQLLRNDIEFYALKKGKFYVLHTFAGGIIFLREPETIDYIKIEFDSGQNIAKASVTYASEKRNARNIKYKPDTGQIESITWNLAGVFPNFSKHKHAVKVGLMAIVGKTTKDICETLKKESWFMKYKKPFPLDLFLDGTPELNYRVETE